MKDQEYKWMIASEVHKDGNAYLDFQNQVYESFDDLEDELINSAQNLTEKFKKNEFIGFFNSLVIFSFDRKTEQTKNVHTVRFSEKCEPLRGFLNALILNNYKEK